MKHAVELMPTVQALMTEVGWRPQDLGHIYVSLGPGSFTGLRISLSIARAIAQATHCKLIGVPTLDVLAQNAPDVAQSIAVALDAKRGQVFGGVYTRLPQGGLKTSFGPALVDPAKLLQEAQHLAPDTVTVYLLGEGVDYHRAAFAAAKVPTAEVDRNLWPARASVVHRLGWARALTGEFTSVNNLLPIYIRLAEAEEVWRRKHNVSL